MSLFGSSGIRGKLGIEFTVDLALKIGAAAGSIADRIIVAKDPRTSGDLVIRALEAGAMSSGASVAEAGMVPTPTLARAASAFDCGLMVTASHNPPEYNGVKMWNPDGSAFDSPQMRKIESLISSGSFRRPDWQGIGSLTDYSTALEDHMRAVIDAVGTAEAEVVVDCANGATSVITPLLLRKLGCKVTSINSQPDGFFPGRSPEPTEEHLGDLRGFVRSKGAALGIAHDGDGDRMVAVDENGRYIDGDRLLALFVVALKARNVVAPVDASMVLDDLVEGKVHRTRVGDVYVAEALKTTGADFGGEPSGTFIFPDQTLCPDGVYAAALLSSMVSDRPLSEMVDSIPKYPVSRMSQVFRNEDRKGVQQRLEQSMRQIDCDRLITVDGYRAEFKDGWFLVRLSGTEPKIRVTTEARSQESLDLLDNLAEQVVGSCLK
jgi:phosphoglucosamine mutase